jgi:hypothetical protein
MPASPDSIAVILPAFDEEATVDAVIRAFHQALPQASIYVAAALEIVAALMLSVGLVLDSIAHQQRMNYELRLLARP